MYKIIMSSKSEVTTIDTRKKKGRPTNNPLVHDVKVRLSKDTYEKLIKYCGDNCIDKAKAIRGWIEDGLTK